MTVEHQPIVIVIDDDASVREALDGLLRSVDLHGAFYGSVRQFLEQPLPDRPSCLVLDVRLPGQRRPGVAGRPHPHGRRGADHLRNRPLPTCP
ncbi:MAG: hypothetical protein WDN45_04045 [Caulobacteraceae bacterium]